MKLKALFAALCLALTVTLFLNGCAGTNAQRIILTTSSMAAQTVNSAYDAWGVDAVAKAKAIAGPSATAEDVVAEVKRSTANRKVMALYDEYRAAMLAYSAANAAATTGTNSVALSTEAFRIHVARSGNAMLDLIQQLTGKPQPTLVP